MFGAQVLVQIQPAEPFKTTNNMGTRNLTLAKIDGEFKIAQYGQWDGYPSGNGEVVLEFLKTWNRPNFEDKLRHLSFCTDDELKTIGENENWSQTHPWLSRDCGAKILQTVHDSKEDLKLKNTLSFAGDSLFCEWAYLLDLDENKLEVYKGLNEAPLTAEDRFFHVEGLEKSDKYHPIKKVAEWPLSDPPSLEEMCAKCDPPEPETEDE